MRFKTFACVLMAFTLNACASDEQMGLCSTLGLCTVDKEEAAAAADKKWWCEYYSGKNCDPDGEASSASSRPVDQGGSDHSGMDHGGGNDNN